MHKKRDVKTVNKTEPKISTAEWNFAVVPDSELVACCYWEYARESKFFQNLRQRCAKAKVRGLTDDDVIRLVAADLDKLHQINPYDEVFFDYNFDKMSFPCAWQELAEADRQKRARINLCLPPAFRRTGSVTAAEMLLAEAKKRVNEYRAAEDKLHREYPGCGGGTLRRMGKWPVFNEGCSVFWDEGTEATIVEIGWEHHTNDQLMSAFRRWVKVARPKRVPEPDGRGQKQISWRVALERLGILRLLHRYSLPALPTKCAPAWKRYDNPNRRWLREAEKARDFFPEALSISARRRTAALLAAEARPEKAGIKYRDISFRSLPPALR